MESVRVTSSIVGTKAADEPNVRFWKALCGEMSVASFKDEYVQVDHIPASGCVFGNVCISIHQRRYRCLLEAFYLVLSAGAIQQAGELCVTVCKFADLEHRRPLDRSWDGLLEQSVGGTIVQSHLGHNGVPTTRLTHDGDIVRVTSKRSDVVFHPLEGEALIQQSGIGRGEGLVCHETERTEAVSDVDGDEVLALTDPIAKVIIRSCAVLQAAALP